MSGKLYFASDYMEGAHPKVLQRLVETNLEHTTGYGTDEYCASAREKLRAACGCPEAEVWFLTGGTQTNATLIDALLRSWEGVVAAESGHIAVHEAGAIEFGGHKVFTLPGEQGKLTAQRVDALLRSYRSDANMEHMVAPGMVYISQPTEYGTLYSKAELTALSEVCRFYGIPLYADGARLAYALACPENDVTLPDLARLCDAFYVGGTKCGTLIGEALVLPVPGRITRFLSIIKQHGALLAKGRVLGVQFDALFTDGLYEELGASAIRCAAAIRDALRENGFELYMNSPTNQVLFIATAAQRAALEERVELAFMEVLDEDRSVLRFCTSWATSEEDTARLAELIRTLR